MKNKCFRCGRVWYCEGNHCGAGNCECDDCTGKVSSENCQEVRIKPDWRIA